MQVEEYCSYNLNDKILNHTELDDFPTTLQVCINKIIKKEGYISYDITKNTISADGGNYLGVLYTVDIKGKTANGDKETNIFIKNILDGDQLKILSVDQVYLNEKFAYNELSKIFTELQDEARVPIKERYKMAKSYDECNAETIFLENLTKKGFKTPFRLDVISLRYGELCIQQLAKFHALSFVLKKKRPVYFEKRIRPMKSAMIYSEEWEGFFKKNCDFVCENLGYEARKKVEALTPDMAKKYFGYLEDTATVCCLCHGDYRANNVMMKEIDGEVTEVVPVDYQLLFYGSPVLDFIYFIYGATDRDFRKKHLTHLKDMYYATMKDYLKYFNMNVEDNYPRKQFEKAFNDKLMFGFIIFVMIMPFLFVYENDAPDFSKQAVTDVSYNLDPRFKDRLYGVVDEFIESGRL